MVTGKSMSSSSKLDSAMGGSSHVVENVKLLEQNLMVCASNCEDRTLIDSDVDDSSEENLMETCENENNCEDSAFGMEVVQDVHDQVMLAPEGNRENVEVEIVDNVNVDSDEEAVGEREPQDMTESSSLSSFGYTDSETENAARPGDMEVESEVRDDSASFLGFGGFGDLCKRKKKVTTHWRAFIHPLMSHCKWVELRIRELNKQASKYDRELAECDKLKQSELEKCVADDLGMKSAPFTSYNRSVKLMKRRKRRRVEETIDLDSYTKSHNLFSYYANKSKPGDGACMDHDNAYADVDPTENGIFGEIGDKGSLMSLDFKESDSFESILRKIEVAQLQVHQLRVRIDKVITETEDKLLNNPTTDLLGSFTGAPNSVLSTVNGDYVRTTLQQTSNKKSIGPEHAVSVHGEVTPRPSMIKSVKPQYGGKRLNAGNKIVICNRPVKEGSNNTQEAVIRQTGTLQTASDPDSAGKKSVSREYGLKSWATGKGNIPGRKRKGKRGRRRGRMKY